MNLQDKIFCALDFSDLNKTIDYVEVIKNHVGGIKLGLEFFCKNGPKGIEKLKKNLNYLFFLILNSMISLTQLLRQSKI